MYYVYKITNIKNGRSYVGLTNNIARRRARHFTDLKRNSHDNKFLQKEYNTYGFESFTFEEIYAAEVSNEQISIKEQEFIKKYDTYRNGYNQNEGGNFGPSNGGTQLTQSDIFNILSVLEFVSRPGEVLSDIYEVSRTTISRIKSGESHTQTKKEYEKLSKEDKKLIFQNFDKSIGFHKRKVSSTIIPSKRQLSRKQVYLILLNFEINILNLEQMKRKVDIKSNYTLYCIRNGKTYQDYVLDYKTIPLEQKEQLASLLSDE